jgi:hypothetical protein
MTLNVIGLMRASTNDLERLRTPAATPIAAR